MVLLTQSTISVIISTTVVCLFTFLLFLSGYVLQQQTVRSLQEALQAPIEVRIRPQIEVSVQSIDGANLDVILDQNALGSRIWTDGGQEVANTAQVALHDGSMTNLNVEPSRDVNNLRELWYRYIDSVGSGSIDEPRTVPNRTSTRKPFNPDILKQDLSLAYIIPVASPETLCSALLFTKQYRTESQLTGTKIQPSMILLYPSDWDHSSDSRHRASLELLVRAEHKHAALLHPVPISKVWNGVNIESQLLSELARNVWTYDRALYLRMPGLITNVDRLDEALISTLTRAAVETKWSKLKSHSRSTSVRIQNPDVLLHAKGKGLMEPRGGTIHLTALLSSARAEADGSSAFVVMDVDGPVTSDENPVELKLLMRRWRDEQDLECENIVSENSA